MYIYVNIHIHIYMYVYITHISNFKLKKINFN